MTFTGDSTLAAVIAAAKGRAVVATHLPELLEESRTLPNLDQRLADLPYPWHLRLPALLRDLNRPAEDVWPDGVEQVSMNDLDREAFAPRFTPWDAEAEDVALLAEPVAHPAGVPRLALDGEWQLAEGGKLSDRLAGDWGDAINARVPGSVHTALVEAGRIPETTFGRNQEIARQESFKTWWAAPRICQARRHGQRKADVRRRRQSLHRMAEWKDAGRARRHVRRSRF